MLHHGALKHQNQGDKAVARLSVSVTPEEIWICGIF